ncbi:DNA polymerase III subunit beta [Thermodesulfovibrio thiophilus]|uniref:DNA polymerase III subunit beta n=1 Tax=Thermodesulfovibrio thiophilus TaxID=340095 RepID=UPI00041080BE|nr:DNA polymerase III subunit beta [Thermodesulfovibrio thiophilus]HHW20738.1 DNA polymerase III subunit beta [Thermodesulfovibrio thiophilus]
MHLKLKKQKIQDNLSKIQNIVEKKSIMPVLNHFLMDVTQNGGYILATDLETAVKQPLDVEVLQPGRACIPAKKFYEIVKELAEDIEITLVEQWIKIQSGRSNFRLATLDPAEFPVWPDIGDATKIDLSRDFLLTAIEKTIYASGDADVRYVLNGLLFHIKASSEFKVVGTDGHRLAVFSAPAEGMNFTEEKKIILSKKSLNELRKFLSDTETVSLHIGKTHVMCEMDGITFLTRMIDGNYPEYEAVIPKNNDKVAVVDKSMFIASLKRVSVLSREHQNAVKTEWDKNLVIISSSDPELGEARDELPIDYQGEPFITGFNARYLIDALEKITSDKAKITMSKPDKAVYITDADVTSFVYECVVMPLRI